MDKTKLRSGLIKAMLGCLIAAATVAVVTILIGKFSDTTGRALGTVLVALVHIAIVFGLVSLVTSKKTDVAPKSTELVVNVTIFVAVLSFFTAVLGIWEVFTGDLPLKLYTTYVVIIFAMIHSKTLVDVSVIYQKVRNYVAASYLFIAIVALMILGAVYSPDASKLLAGFYGRLLAASAIVDVTLSITCAVMYRLHIQRNPELIEGKLGSSHGALKIIMALMLFFFFVAPLLMWLAAMLIFKNA